jgi:hypothetical protein
VLVFMFLGISALHAQLQEEAATAIPPVAQVTLYGLLKTTMHWEGNSAIAFLLKTPDGTWWPVTCRRPNLGPCVNTPINPLPASLRVVGAVRVVCQGPTCAIEVNPTSIARLPPFPNF